MVDFIPPPPLPPPKDPDPVEGSEAWHTQQENKTKRKNFGATIGFASDQKIRFFIFEMTFKSKIDEATSVINLYTPHKTFISQLFALTTSDAHIVPTLKINNEDNNCLTRSPVLLVDAFPATTYQHGKFFGTAFFYNKKTQRTVVKIAHKVLMKETVIELKRKMME
jgi:hypothetical protein